MASITASNVSTNLVGRELSIASSFVKQYYTLLNRAPQCIHNFYSQDSTFIHGTIDMANEQYTEPVVGREEIKQKVGGLKLKDCRAKIKQIDCLETLAGGLVIQVIGELSNDGKPMRRFLQTFVLAPKPAEPSQENDSQNARTAVNASDRRGNNVDENSCNSSTHNQIFFVLNSIFRYQDDGPDSEFENESSSLHANSSTEAPNGSGNDSNKDVASKQAHNDSQISQSNGLVTVPDYSQNRKRPLVNSVRSVDNVDRLAHDLDEGVKLNKHNLGSSSEPKRDLAKVLPNGTSETDKKSESSGKSENGRGTVEQISTSSSATGSSSLVANPNVTALSAIRPQPSNEPKTWANMVRNAHPQPTVSVQVGINKTLTVDNQMQLTPTVQSQPSQLQPQQTQPQLQQPQPPSPQQQTQIQQQQPHQSLQQQPQTQPNQTIQQQQQPSPPQHHQLLQPHLQNSQLIINNNNNNINNTNNRRRNIMRKPSNKSNGRSIKSRPRPPTTAGMSQSSLQDSVPVPPPTGRPLS